ncbi:efflux RND transporter periplasmic adaptor subunit [Azospira restricta]|uniref:Efflux RND transporter periplasmic adaptor subunit n=1 Tax=Azospira restricta TaxID=404405 RepID=A0A974PXZ3_9RHOO|nr:efflux RND transporter periplasmic adaptor subunit [Azospira restricta]QRJ63554.1 efflux RND transporter periplasmic adaptor subunit [Azospira restricta]
MQKSLRRHGVAIVSVLALGGLAYLAYNAYRAPAGAAAPAAGNAAAAKPGAGAPPAGGFPTAVELTRVARVSLVIDATAVGSLRSNESVTLRPETAGRIAAINFKDGVPVGKGAVLVALDDATQSAELAQARANLELAKATFKRNEELFAKKFISSQALDSAAATLRVQQAALALAEAKQAKTQIRAPFSGVVGIRNVSVGDYVKEGQDLINLEDMRTLKVDFRLPEAMLPRLKVGQPVEVVSDALPGERFTATLAAIDPLVDANGRAIACRARLDNAGGQLRPGMFVRTRLIFEARDDALMIPEQALVADPQQAFVFTVVDGKAKKVPVKTGLRRGAQVEVVEGLKEGDVVVAAGQLKLRDGAPVRDAAAPPPGTPAPAAKPETPAKAAS